MGGIEEPVPERLQLPAKTWAQMQAQAEGGAPEEVCGILAGRGEAVQQLYPVENALHSPVRFRMNPHGQLAAFQDIEQNDLDLVAIYHSHPSGPAVPSPTDINEAYYPDTVTIILSRTTSGWQARAFHMNKSGYREIPLEIRE